jgi:small subunit ribosomal protein S3
MGHKVNPNGLRIGITRNWESSWYAPRKKYGQLLHQDILLRKKIIESLQNSGISKIEIERFSNRAVVHIHTSKPGVIIGKQGTTIQDLKTNLEKEFKEHFDINIKEIKKPYLDAHIVAELIGQQISNRIPFRRAIKSVMEKVTESGAKGVKVYVGGRLNGVEIARSEYFLNGKIPLQTLRSDIDYARYTAPTIYGSIGLKVWIYKGEHFTRQTKNNN